MGQLLTEQAAVWEWGNTDLALCFACASLVLMIFFSFRGSA